MKSWLGALEGPPPVVAVGRGTVLVARGWVSTERGVRIEGFRLRLDGEVSTARSSRELREHDAERVTEGFWFAVDVVAEGRREVAVDARIDGTWHEVGTQTVELVESALTPSSRTAPLVVCLCTYEPDPQLLAVQLSSLRAQTVTDWICLVQDDASSPARFAELERLCAADPRFVVERNPTNIGFYRNFERCLFRVPSNATHVALCDQDDRWDEGKLEACLQPFADPAVQLVYCDMRLVGPDGERLADTYWTTRRNNFESFETLLFANTVTGAASIVRRELLDLALPFPDDTGCSYHDHWLACVALASGRIAYVDRALYDYTQHARNVIGHSSFRSLTLGQSVAHQLSVLGEVVRAPSTRILPMLAVHHEEHRKLELYRRTLELRCTLPEKRRRVLALFDDTLVHAFLLATREHAAVHRRGDTTDMAELKLGASVLINRFVEPLLIATLHLRARGRHLFDP